MKQGGDPHRRGKPPIGGLAISQSQAAEALGVGKRTVERASSIKAADPELFEKVKSGEVTIAVASKQLAKPVTKESKAEVESNRLLRLWDKTGREGRALFLQVLGLGDGSL